jgi:hypothetical protein
MPALLAAAVLTSRLAINSLPPNSYGLAAEVVKDPWVMRIDTAYNFDVVGNRGAWAVTLAYPMWCLGEVQVGPLLGVNGSLPGTPPRPKEIVLLGASGPALTVGASIRWQGERWWVTACPNLSLAGLASVGLFGLMQDLALPLVGCPPVLEVGYQLTPALGLALRASALPVGPSWRF